MKTRKQLGKGRHSPLDVLNVLLYIHENRGLSVADIAQHVKRTECTVKEIIASVEKQYGVIILWQRNTKLDNNRGYSILDWGVFDPERLVEFLKADSKRTTT